MPIGYQDIMTHISRAKSSMAKFDSLKTMNEAVSALRMLAKGAVLQGREKFEIEILIDEVLRGLCNMEEMKSIFPKGLSFQRGREKELLERLTQVSECIGQAIGKAETDKIRAKFNEIDRYICQGQKLLDIKSAIEARKVFRKAQELFPDEPGLNFDIGNRLLRAGYAPESVEYFEAAMARDPRDPRAYASLVSAYEAVGETEMALELVKTIFRTFGANDRVYLKLAELNHKLRRWDECYDAAKAAKELNPHSKAQLIMDKVATKIF